jgi:hypothetical protein
MATKTPPPPKKKSAKGEPPKSSETRSNLMKPEPAKLVDLNFKVSAEFRKDFKIAAATHGIKQVELLQEIFEYWSQAKG